MRIIRDYICSRAKLCKKKNCRQSLQCRQCEYRLKCAQDSQKPDYCPLETRGVRIGDLHDKALRKSQSNLTLQEVSDWLMKRYKLGWIAHNEIPCPQPEVFDLTFYKSDIDSLSNGVIPER